jgi:hypothetical protein
MSYDLVDSCVPKAAKRPGGLPRSVKQSDVDCSRLSATPPFSMSSAANRPERGLGGAYLLLRSSAELDMRDAERLARRQTLLTKKYAHLRPPERSGLRFPL